MAGDALWNSVVLAMHMDGANGATVFIDEKGKTATPVGNAQISTAQSKFGGSSALFDGTGDYLTVPNNSDWRFGSGDFTIEAWIRFSALPASNTGMAFVARYTGQRSWLLNCYNNAGTFGFQGMLSSDGSTNLIARWETTPSINVWYHVAMVRSGTTLYLYVDGVQRASVAVGASAIYDNALAVAVGAYSDGASNYFNGYIDDLRITKGVARYTANFTPPTSAFYDYAGEVTGTVKNSSNSPIQRLVRVFRQSNGALAGQAVSAADGAFTIKAQTLDAHFAVVHDANELPPVLYMPMNGVNGSVAFSDLCGKQISQYGNAAISTAQSKFGGASAFFGGASDYLSVPFSSDFDIGVGDFTIEFWFRPEQISTAKYLLVLRDVAITAQRGFQITQPGSDPTKIRFACGDNIEDAYDLSITSVSSLTVGVFHHFAVTRSGTSFRMFLNGEQQGSAVEWGGRIAVGGYPLYIAAGNDSGLPFHGYLDDLRITKGAARYTANFTPPTVAQAPTFGSANALIFDHLTPA